MAGARAETTSKQAVDVQPGLTDMTAADAVRRMTAGDISVETYAAALLARCKSRQDLNAFITLDPDRVLEDARERDRERRGGKKAGPLFGLPMPIKDSVNTQQYPTTGGTPALRAFRPAADAPIVATLRAAGAIVLGKTNLHELSFGWTTNNLAFGPVHNPYDVTRVPGGSSGGTAAAIAAHLAPLGVAEDTEGSVRVPAAYCGIAGFRPTTGRYPTQACVPITRLFDQIGPHARNVADLLLFDSVVANEWSAATPPPLRGVRLGVVRDYWYTDLDPEVERITNSALVRLRDAGAVIVDGTIPDLAHLIALTTDPIQNHDVLPELSHYLRTYGAKVGVDELIASASSDIRGIFASDILPGGANVTSDRVYTEARDRYLPALHRAYRDYFARANVSAIVFPTTLTPAPLIGEETTLTVGAGRKLPFEVAVARNIAPGSTAGLPGLVLPAGLTRGGLPVALEFDAPATQDRALLALGVSLERALGAIAPPKGV
ncbi:MAG: amidase family protein [Pseudomonadota bacterium]|nr:amidase family protein [Pseudomonadota bacterium]